MIWYSGSQSLLSCQYKTERGVDLYHNILFINATNVNYCRKDRINCPEVAWAQGKNTVRRVKKKCNFALPFRQGLCGCGVIGSRARLRILCLRAWGFESLHPHKLIFIIQYNFHEHQQREYRSPDPPSW